MNLKKIIVIIVVIICSGCNAKYKIEFNDEKINESLNVTVPKTMTIEEYKNSYGTIKTTQFGENEYDFDIKEKNGEVTLKYNREFTVDNYNSSYIANSCFQTVKLLSDDEKYYLFGQGNFKCVYYKYSKLKTLDISIETNYKVIETNADEIEQNEYIWHIDENNYNDKSIKLITSKETVKENILEKNKDVMKILGIAALSALIILIIFSIRYKRVNKI